MVKQYDAQAGAGGGTQRNATSPLSGDAAELLL